MKKEVIKYTIKQDGKKVKKGKIKAYIPSERGLEKYIKNLPNVMPMDESMFIINMLNFHFLFPADDIFYDKNIKNEELRYMLKQKENDSNSISIKYDNLIYKSLLNDRIFKINMSPEDYDDFRVMILKEISDIKNDYSNIFDKELIKFKQQQNIIKRIKLFFRNRKFIELKKKLITETIQDLNREAIIKDNKKSEYKFYERAYKLIKEYNENEYNKLIKDITDYLKKEYEEYNNYREYKEEIEYINSGKSMEQKIEILIWICSNMSPRGEALDAMRLDATYIYDQILNNYYKLEYKKIRNEMTYEEKRLFQLLFFGRKAFLYKIPALTQFIYSFFNANSELIFEGLILKMSNPDYKEKNEELKKKWYEFLNMYSIAIKNYSVIENAGNKEKIKEIIRNNFKDEEIEILECIQENYSYDVICAQFNKNEEYISNLLERLQNTIREESNNEISKKEN
ncbi:MAG: hypothetical protein UIT70_00650 [Clostridia bacterium]|nr:hypothetical protein [Clostridia bacterium]